MLLIRIFLWTMVIILCIQGYTSDHYGSIGLTLSILKSRLTIYQDIAIPRAFVMAAIKETMKHPTIVQVPVIQRRLDTIQKILADLRVSELTWRLKFNDMVASLQLEKPWFPALQRMNLAKARLNNATCWIPSMCQKLNENYLRAKANPWLSIMEYRPVPAHYWLKPADSTIFYGRLKTLYNLTVQDNRIMTMLEWIGQFTPFVKTLMEGDLWSALIDHVVHQDFRVRNLLDRAGLLEVQQVHERIYNLSAQIDPKISQPWFDEAAALSWWLPDTIPAIVRRCISSQTGDCTRIGSVEIEFLQNRLTDRWSLVLIGLWNGLPMVMVLFVMELICYLSSARLFSGPPSSSTLSVS